MVDDEREDCIFIFCKICEKRTVSTKESGLCRAVSESSFDMFVIERMCLRGDWTGIYYFVKKMNWIVLSKIDGIVSVGSFSNIE